MSYSQNIGPYSFKSPSNQISMSIKVFPNIKSLPLNSLLGFPQADRVLVQLPNPPSSTDGGGFNWFNSGIDQAILHGD